jgi:hypothetical protein
MSDRPTFSASDLKKLLATKSSPENVVKLCYSQREVYIKPIKIKDKKEILKSIETKNEVVINKAFDDILEKFVEAVDGQEFTIGELTTQERQQLLVHIKVAASGTNANIMHECPACGEVNQNIKYDLSKMFIKNYVKPDTGEEIIISTLSGTIKVQLGPITRNKEIEIEKHIKRNKITQTTEKNFAMMAAAIKSISIVQDDIETEVSMTMDELIDIFDSLPEKELEKIMNYFKSSDFGAKMPFDFKCQKCGHESEQEVNATVFFIN